MLLKAQNLVLTKSQAACLVALQHRTGSKAEIAILARLDLLKTAAALRVLMRLGLARQEHSPRRCEMSGWETYSGLQRRTQATIRR